MYSATKRFVNSFSLGVAYEVSDKVDFLCLVPGVVETKMTGMKANLICLTTTQCVSGALDSLGNEKISYGHLKHALLGTLN